MIKPSTADYDWDEALAHLELLGHRGVGVTKISAFRAKPEERLRYLGVFEPAHYQLAIEQMRELNRQHPTLSFFVGFSPLYKSALEYAPNRFIANRAQPKKEDVSSTTNMVLDIDPASERNKSSSEEREAVLTVANNILDTEPLLAEWRRRPRSAGSRRWRARGCAGFDSDSLVLSHREQVDRQGADEHRPGSG